MEGENSSSGSAAWSGVDLSAIAPNRAQALRSLMAAADIVCAGDESAGERPDGVEAAAIAQALAAVVSRLTAAKIGLLPVIEADGRWAVGGAKSFATWIADRQDLGIQSARSQVKMSRTLRDALPLTAQAVVAGAITVEHAPHPSFTARSRIGPRIARSRKFTVRPSASTNRNVTRCRGSQASHCTAAACSIGSRSHTVVPSVRAASTGARRGRHHVARRPSSGSEADIFKR